MFDIKIEIPKDLQESMRRAFDLTNSILGLEMQRHQQWAATPIGRPMVTAMSGPLRPEDEPTEEEKEMAKVWMAEMDSVITQEAVSMVKEEIRQMMVMGGNVKRVAEELKKGKKPKLVRKKEGRRDPLYIQFGDGVDEPIEEIHLFG